MAMSILFSTNVSHPCDKEHRSNSRQYQPFGTFWPRPERRSVARPILPLFACTPYGAICLHPKNFNCGRASPTMVSDVQSSVQAVIKTDQHRQVLPIVYSIAGLAVCVMNLAQADVTHHDDFLYYLLCGAIAALGLRSTHRNAIPVSFLVMLLAIEDLSLPELIF